MEPGRDYLTFEDLSKVYATRDGACARSTRSRLSERRGEFLSILGPSGCGKSTLLMIAAGLMPPSSGSVAVDGAPVTAPRTDIGIVFQSPVLLEWRTALGNVMLQAEAKQLDRAVRRAARPRAAGRGRPRAASRTNTRTSFPAACASASRSAVR